MLCDWLRGKIFGMRHKTLVNTGDLRLGASLCENVRSAGKSLI